MDMALMKNKTEKPWLLIIFLGSFVAIFVAITRFAESLNDRLPLKEVWTFQADDRILATPILIDDQIIFRTANKIYSISATDGSINWKTTTKASDLTINVSIIKKPIVANSKFVVSEEKGNSIGIYLTKTGEKIWTVEGQGNFINAIEIVDDVLVVATHDASLVVYDLTSHQKLWEVALPARSPTPIAANADSVILGARNALRIYGLKDGALLDEKRYDTSIIWEIALSESNIFVSHAKDGGDESISSLQLDSLDENWIFHAGKIMDPHLSVTIDRLSIFNQTLLLLDTSSGNVLWEDDTQEYYSAPAFHENSLFFISTQGVFGTDKKICKVQIRKGVMEACSGVNSSAMIFNSQRHLLGPLATNDLLIVPHDSEITAFRMP